MVHLYAEHGIEIPLHQRTIPSELWATYLLANVDEACTAELANFVARRRIEGGVATDY